MLGAQERKEATKNFGLTERDRFEGSTTLRTKGGATAQVHAKIHQWSIPGRQTAALPEHGFLVIQLRAGEATTTIDGKHEKRRAGDFWTVPANSKMSVQVTSETAVLEVMSLAIS
jgi:quercetin dioxygenase-like cupin family protein